MEALFFLLFWKQKIQESLFLPFAEAEGAGSSSFLPDPEAEPPLFRFFAEAEIAEALFFILS